MTEAIFHILLSLRDGPRDAEAILAQMRALAPNVKPPALASFYRALKKASAKRYLAVTRIAESGARGRPRQLYRITRSGRTALEAEARRLERLAMAALEARK
ncbi:MAG TPA: helix-turn-helix transcriptional regulator [Vicinamibacteria bacterium]|nr:helix-turn-helix transcriptional regulator [Vicinamibacteria bacterium]